MRERDKTPTFVPLYYCSVYGLLSENEIRKGALRKVQRIGKAYYRPTRVIGKLKTFSVCSVLVQMACYCSAVMVERGVVSAKLRISRRTTRCTPPC
jgi:hypothetical protein